MHYHRCITVVLMLSIIGSCKADEADIVTCMSVNNASNVHAPTSSSYSSLLEVAQQNPRWANSSSTPKPLFIVTPTTVAEVQEAIVCSRKKGIQVRVKSGGHDYEGLSFLSYDDSPFIILDLVSLKSISVDLKGETAWVQSGATLGELYYRISEESKGGLGFPAGLCPSVGVGGQMSGGGIGTMMRKHGLAADNVVDALLVDVNGRVLDRKAMGEDLFWAIRGSGGTSFGVVAAWKVRLVRVPPVVTVFSVQRSPEEGIKLIHKWQYIASKLPEDLFVRAIIQKIEYTDPIQVLFDSLFLGRRDDLIRLVNQRFPELQLKAEECTELSWIDSVMFLTGYRNGESLRLLLDRVTQFKSSFKGKSDFVEKPFPLAAFKGVLDKFSGQKFVFMIMDPFGGKMDEISEDEIAFPHRKRNLYNIQYMVKWGDDSEGEASIQWIRMLHKFMSPYVSSSPRAAYVNYRDLDLGINQHNTSYSQAAIWGKQYFKGNFKRLAQIKSHVDPDNYFRNEQSIPPIAYRGGALNQHGAKEV